MNIDGKKITDLRFADDIALITTSVRQMEKQLNMINEESKKISLKIHRGKTKYMMNFNSKKKIIVDETEIEKVNEYKYLGQTIAMEDTTPNEVKARIRSSWSTFGRYKCIFTNKELPMCLKRKAFNTCIIPAMIYGCQTWTLTKSTVDKLRKCQRAMERKMLGISLRDKVENTQIRVNTGLEDVVEVLTKAKMEVGRACGQNGR